MHQGDNMHQKSASVGVVPTSSMVSLLKKNLLLFVLIACAVEVEETQG